MIKRKIYIINLYYKLKNYIDHLDKEKISK